MADDPTTKVNSSTIPFSSIVEDADSGPEVLPAYTFSNGRTFVEPKR